MEEIKPEVKEQYDFQYRDRSIKITPINYWYQPDFDAKNQLNEFSIEPSAACVHFSIDTLIKENKLVVTEKNELENRDKSILEALFGLVRLSEF